MLAWALVRYSFPGQEARRCADRPSVRAADGGRRHRAHRALRQERLARPVSRAARHQGRLHAARRARGARLHRPAVRRADRAADSRGPRRRVRGGGRQPRRHALADVSAVSCCRRLLPALLTGFALAFARAVGEYGSVIFIAGNIPMVSEITPLIIITKLEQYDYDGRHRHRGGDARRLLHPAARSSTGCRPGPRDAQGGRSDGRSSSRIALQAGASPRFEASVATRDPRWVKCLVVGDRARLLRALPAPAADRRLRRGVAQGLGRLLRRARRARRPIRHSLDTARRRHRRPGQPRLRHGGRVGHRQVRLSRQAAG